MGSMKNGFNDNMQCIFGWLPNFNLMYKSDLKGNCIILKIVTTVMQRRTFINKRTSKETIHCIF